MKSETKHSSESQRKANNKKQRYWGKAIRNGCNIAVFGVGLCAVVCRSYLIAGYKWVFPNAQVPEKKDYIQ